MSRFKPVFMLLLSVMLLGGYAWAQTPDKLATTFTVHKVFGDHMVLQCGKPIKISGTAGVGESVKVTIGNNTAYGTANAKGEWMAELPAMSAGTDAYEVTVSGADASSAKTFKDVLIGEVWLASGQSNMQFSVKSSLNSETEIANSTYPMIRLYNTKRVRAPGAEQEESPGPGWVLCAPETVPNFSALGYYFARQLYNDLKVPIGVIHSSWGATPVESWISEESYQNANRFGELRDIEADRPAVEKLTELQKAIRAKTLIKLSEYEKEFFGTDPAATKRAKVWKNAELDDSSWKEVAVPVAENYILDGVFWYRFKVEIPESWKGQELVISLGEINDCDETYFNGELVGSTDTSTTKYWLKSRAYKIPAKLVKPGQSNVIAVRVADLYGNCGIVGPAEKLFLQAGADEATRISLAGKWKFQTEFSFNPLTKGMGQQPCLRPMAVESQRFPGSLYNSMIAPWTVYPIRGVIWYQGEGNAGRYQDYMKLFPLLINDWRAKWGEPDLPFLFVQLAAFQKHSPKNRGPEDFWKTQKPADTSWPKLREVQTATLKLPNTGMAVAIDVGDAYDIHPKDKQTLGYRMGKEAERICYGFKGVSSGPMFSKMDIEGNKVRLHFTNIGSGLEVRGEELGAFAIAGKDGKFVWAKAQVDGDTVVVWSDEVSQPVEVRYAWSHFPGNANLYNKEGFPACPFRTAEVDYLLK